MKRNEQNEAFQTLSAKLMYQNVASHYVPPYSIDIEYLQIGAEPSCRSCIGPVKRSTGSESDEIRA